jgi:FkbM family methyltransferase
MIDDLIYDVGLNDGSDTAFYLHCGYRVLAIEADPNLCALAAQRFAAEIEHGRLTILNIGIADRAGTAEFWICDLNPGLSSFDEANMGGAPHHAVSIPCRTFDQVLAEYGTPYYLKIDIEGSDPACLQALPIGGDLPRYLSTELRETYDSLRRLVAVGYTHFKCISQFHFTPLGLMQSRYERWYPVLRHLRWLAHIIFKLARRRVVSDALFRTQHDANWTFSKESSGTFGEATAGRWLSAEELHATYQHYLQLFMAGKPSPFWNKNQPILWCDLHARRDA